MADYESTPRITDPTELLAEEKLRSAWLRQLLAERDAELAARERAINAAYLDSLG
ncbi:hypothetical protein [Mycolicibacterium hodleri]|uniref:hypothetical protein n=1 Tax=Mycolicibacterium hodleri TaxID=49897 RepID=UPI0021F30EEE|nr:hypothetical protein [Mycolicibacterium hodleri]